MGDSRADPGPVLQFPWGEVPVDGDSFEYPLVTPVEDFLEGLAGLAFIAMVYAFLLDLPPQYTLLSFLLAAAAASAAYSSKGFLCVDEAAGAVLRRLGLPGGRSLSYTLCHLEDLRAVAVDAEKVSTRHSSYWSYAVVLVDAWGDVHAVTPYLSEDDGGFETAAGNGRVLAERLDLPFLECEEPGLVLDVRREYDRPSGRLRLSIEYVEPSLVDELAALSRGVLAYCAVKLLMSLLFSAVARIVRPRSR